MSCFSPVIVALDYPNMADTLAMAKQLDPSKMSTESWERIIYRNRAGGLRFITQFGF